MKVTLCLPCEIQSDTHCLNCILSFLCEVYSVCKLSLFLRSGICFRFILLSFSELCDAGYFVLSMPNLDLMSSLFLYDYDWPLQNIFLSLDTASLRVSRDVCRQWRIFIDRRVIGCTRYRKMITDKIWEEFRYSKKIISVNKEVTSIRSYNI